MSTKGSIKARSRTADLPGFHLYDDVLDDLGARDDDLEPPVYLRLDGVAVRLETLTAEGATVTVTVPRETARELGLLPVQAGLPMRHN